MNNAATVYQDSILLDLVDSILSVNNDILTHILFNEKVIWCQI